MAGFALCKLFMMESLNGTYAHPPITEAMLYIQVVPAEETTLEDLKKIGPKFSVEFTEGSPISQFTSQFDQGRIASSSSTELGFRFSALTPYNVLQARLDGYYFSQLAPYSKWSEFAAEAHRGWALFQDVIKPKSIMSIGLRYINRINLPLPIRDFRDYMRTYPELSSDLPNQVSSFFFQSRSPIDPEKLLLTINEALLPDESSTHVSIILDIEVVDLQAQQYSEEEIWRRFEVIRMKKNEAFEACITNRTRALFN